MKQFFLTLALLTSAVLANAQEDVRETAPTNESPYLVRLIMETIHKNNKTKIKHIGSR